MLRLVEAYIRRENPYAQSYRMLKEVLANVHDRDVTDVVLAINPVQRGQWARRTVPLEHRYYGDRCELAATSSVAAVFVGEVPPVSYDVRVQMRGDTNNAPFRPQFEQDRILFNSQSVDPLCYTLLHLHGEPAWGGSVSRLEGGGFCTKKQYYAYRMMVRRGEYNPLFAAEKLALQYVCDAALKIDIKTT